MKTKILIAGLACLSVVAVAQQSSSEQKPTSKAATSPIGGKKGYDYDKGHNLGMQHDPSPSTVREDPSKSNPAVSVADVNADGHADKVAASPSNASGQNATTSHSQSNVVAPRDVATGHSSGKRMHQPVSVSKQSDGKPKQ